MVDPMTVSRIISRTGLVLQKYSPAIMTGVGVAGSITATILACKQTPKAIVIKNELAESLKATDEVHELWKQAKQNGDALNVDGKAVDYDEKTRLTERTLYIRNAVLNWLKVYAVPLAVGAVSLGLIVSGHKIMWTRNAAIMAAFEAMKTSFDRYRENVRAITDNETDRLALGGFPANKPSHDNMSDEELEEQGLKEVALVSPASLYCRWFDEFNPNWDNNSETNRFFLLSVQAQMNDLLRARGHVFLNEVFDRLGFKRTPAGARCGWVWQGDGDNVIDFGLFKTDEAHKDFINSWEKSVLLDFNVDGDIHNLI